MLPLTGLLGAIIALLFVAPIPDLSDFEDLDLSMPDLSSALANISWYEGGWQKLRSDLEEAFEPARDFWRNRDFEVGMGLKEEGLEAYYPVILIPGIISTGLESWTPGAFFRKRVWGSTSMIQAIISDRTKWMKHLELDPITGLDPNGIKVRAAQGRLIISISREVNLTMTGLDAASVFMPGYWIWSKIIENLSCINYDTNNLQLAAYEFVSASIRMSRLILW